MNCFLFLLIFMFIFMCLRQLCTKQQFDFKQLSKPLSIKFNDEIIESKINQKYILPFKNKHLGETCVILGTGPTLNDYIPIPNVVHMGVNSIVYYNKLIVDYYFIADYDNGKSTFLNNKNQILKYKPKLQKFFGTFYKKKANIKKNGIPIQFIDKETKQFEVIEMTAAFYPPPENFGKFCFGLPVSTIFWPFQFAIHCGFKNIILVGCDCTTGNFVLNTNHSYNTVLETWKLVSIWMQKQYPNVNVQVINPRGLKGVFKEYNQKYK